MIGKRYVFETTDGNEVFSQPRGLPTLQDTGKAYDYAEGCGFDTLGDCLNSLERQLGQGVKAVDTGEDI